jgi:hypothetical protein
MIRPSNPPLASVTFLPYCVTDGDDDGCERSVDMSADARYKPERAVSSPKLERKRRDIVWTVCFFGLSL